MSRPPVWFYLAWAAIASGLYLALMSWMQAREMTAENCKTSQTRYLTPAQFKQCEDVLR